MIITTSVGVLKNIPWEERLRRGTKVTVNTFTGKIVNSIAATDTNGKEVDGYRVSVDGFDWWAVVPSAVVSELETIQKVEELEAKIRKQQHQIENLKTENSMLKSHA